MMKLPRSSGGLVGKCQRRPVMDATPGCEYRLERKQYVKPDKHVETSVTACDNALMHAHVSLCVREARMTGRWQGIVARALVLSACTLPLAGLAKQPLHVDAGRLQQHITGLSKFGANPEGGVS